MSETFNTYNCGACQASFDSDIQHKLHFKSELHRYNLKRKLIDLPSVSAAQFELQLAQDALKSSSQSEIRCDVCCKSFMSTGTYAQHTASLKHKQRCKELYNKETQKRTLRKSSSSTSSTFELLVCGGQNQEGPGECMICAEQVANLEKHLQQHNFPPFKESCRRPKELQSYVAQIIEGGECLYCGLSFSSAEAARQHMSDVGHGMLNTNCFGKYEKFYEWKIQEEGNESDSEDWEPLEETQQVSSGKILTLEDLNEKLQNRIVLTKTGAKIGEKHIGVRCFKQYYRQYFREIKCVSRNLNMAIENKENSGFCREVIPSRQFARKMAGKKVF